MNGYLIDSGCPKDAAKVTAGIHETISSLYPDIRVDSATSLNAQTGQVLFVRESSHERIWGRIFFEPLTHLLLETLAQNFEEVQRALKQWHGEELSLKAFVFFPSCVKGVPAFFSHFSPDWSFFKYCFLKSSDHEALALKEYPGAREAAPALPAPAAESFIKEPDASSRFFQQTGLSREELNEFLELTLELKTFQ